MLEKLFERPHALRGTATAPSARSGVGIFPTLPVSTCRWKLCVPPRGISSPSQSVFDSPPAQGRPSPLPKSNGRPLSGSGPGRPKPKTDDPRARLVRRAIRWLRFMGRLEPSSASPIPHQALITAFARHLQREKGLSPHSITCRCRDVREFLDRLVAPGSSLHAVTMAQIEDFLVEKVTQARYGGARSMSMPPASGAFSVSRSGKAGAVVA